MMSRFLAQLIMIGGQVVARALAQALRQEFRAAASARETAKDAGRSGFHAMKGSAISRMSIQEASQILNVENVEDLEAVRKNYEHLFKMNSKKAGGSFYLQSKVVRAKERIEMELNQKVGLDAEEMESNHGHGPDAENSSESNSRTKQS